MEFLKELLAAVGGAVGVVLIILIFFKGVIQKWIDTTIDKAAEKSLAKYSNTLERKTKAYEILLDKELSYYEYLSETMTEFMMTISDFTVLIGVNGDPSNCVDISKAQEKFREIQDLEFEFISRNNAMLCYVQTDISIAVLKLVGSLQLVNECFTEGINQRAENNGISEEMRQKIVGLSKTVVKSTSSVNNLIKQRLTALSQE